VCRLVTVNASQAGGAAGSTYVPVDFTNTSGSPCGLYGYPGMSFVTAGDGSGSQIGAAAQENPSFGKVPVQLAAGASASTPLLTVMPVRSGQGVQGTTP